MKLPLLEEELPGLKTSDEYHLERPRWKWVVSAAKALIASMDPHLRWLTVQAGTDEFIRVARPKFQASEPGIRFTEDELRWMFACLVISLPLRFREAMRASEIERFVRKALTEAELKGSGGEGPTGHQGPSETHEGGITTETLPDRDKVPVETIH